MKAEALQESKESYLNLQRLSGKQRQYCSIIKALCDILIRNKRNSFAPQLNPITNHHQSMNTKKQVLSSLIRLLRTRRIVFKGDTFALNETRKQILSEYKQHKHVKKLFLHFSQSHRKQILKKLQNLSTMQMKQLYFSKMKLSKQ